MVEVKRKKTGLQLSFQLGKTRFVTTTTRSELAAWEKFFAHEWLVNRTHYDVLGLPPTASAEEINKAYRRLVVSIIPIWYKGSVERFITDNDWPRRVAV